MPFLTLWRFGDAVANIFGGLFSIVKTFGYLPLKTIFEVRLRHLN